MSSLPIFLPLNEKNIHWIWKILSYEKISFKTAIYFVHNAPLPQSQSQWKFHYSASIEPELHPLLLRSHLICFQDLPSNLTTHLHFWIPCDITLVAAFGQVFEGLLPHILPYLPLFHLFSLLVLLVTHSPSTLPLPYDHVKQNVCS